MNKVCIVGSADSLTGKGLGEVIDSHDIIIRINQPLISGFEKDVGSRITHSFISPWQITGCRQRIGSFVRKDLFDRLKEEKGTVEIVLACSDNGLSYDFNSFYKEIAPLIDDKVKLNFICFRSNTKKWKRQGFTARPTNGTILVDHYSKSYRNINIAGFGHPQNESQECFYHYWGCRDLSKNSYGVSKESHKINEDISWLKRLHDKNSINILELDESNNTI
jgi:hypothetical protein